MRAWFGGAALVVVSTSAAFVYVCAWVALPLSEAEVGGVRRLCWAAALVALSALAVASAVFLRGFASVRRRAVEGVGSPLFTGAAGVFHGPTRVTMAAAAAVLLLVLLDAAGAGAVSGIVGPRRVAVDVLVFGVLQSGLLYVAQAWRGLLWAWLSRLNPNDVMLPTRPFLARRYALRVASAFTLLGASILSVPLAYLASAQELVGLSSARLEAVVQPYVAAAISSVLIVGAVAVFLGYVIGRRIAADVNDLDAYVRSLGSASDHWSSESLPVLPEIRMRTAVAHAIARSVRDLSAKYAAMAWQERRSRRAIEDMQRLKARFMAFMSHDLRSPLNAITGFADILADEIDGPLNAEQRRSVQAIRESGRALVRLVTDIVDTARIEAGRLELSREPTDLVHLTREAIEQARCFVRAPGPRFEVRLGERPPTLDVDRDRALQALVGVLAYVTRMVPEGTICIECAEGTAEDGTSVTRLRIRAEDLPPEDTQRIFVAFREVKRPSGRRVGGLGLGLALARSLVVAHGGDLHYESDGPAFVFELPVHRQDGHTELGTVEEREPSGSP